MKSIDTNKAVRQVLEGFESLERQRIKLEDKYKEFFYCEETENMHIIGVEMDKNQAGFSHQIRQLARLMNKSNGKALKLSGDKDFKLYGLEYYAKKAQDKRKEGINHDRPKR